MKTPTFDYFVEFVRNIYNEIARIVSYVYTSFCNNLSYLGASFATHCKYRASTRTWNGSLKRDDQAYACIVN